MMDYPTITQNPETFRCNCAIVESGERDLPQWFVDYMMRRRQALIMELGEIEDILQLERSIVPRRKR